MNTTEKTIPTTADDINGDISSLNAIIDRLKPHLPESAHLVNSVGAMRTAVACLENHLDFSAKAAAKV